VSVLANGAKWIWDSSALEFYGQAQENLDIFHALEYLSRKGEELFGKETKECEFWFESTKYDLLHGGVPPLLERVKLLRECEVSEQQENVLRVLQNYLEYHSGRTHYRERLALGKSIGSGQVEGACKNLVGRRLKQTGACWLESGVNGLAALCAVLYGEQWNDYWKSAV
jgi:hypothetical protein